LFHSFTLDELTANNIINRRFFLREKDYIKEEVTFFNFFRRYYIK